MTTDDGNNPPPPPPPTMGDTDGTRGWGGDGRGTTMMPAGDGDNHYHQPLGDAMIGNKGLGEGFFIANS